MIRLKDLHIRRISTVDQPDNPGARIVLFKRKQEVKMAKDAPTVEELTKQITALTTQLEKVKEDSKGQKDDRNILKRLAELFSKKEGANTGNDELDILVNDLNKRREDDAARIEKQNATIAKLQTGIERDKMFDLAKSLQHLGEADDTVSVLLKMKGALTDEEFASYVKTQKALAAQIRESGLFKEFGSDNSNDVSGVSGVEAEIDAAVDALVEKSSNGKTREQLEAGFLTTKAGKALWEKYEIAKDRQKGA